MSEEKDGEEGEEDREEEEDHGGGENDDMEVIEWKLIEGRKKRYEDREGVEIR